MRSPLCTARAVLLTVLLLLLLVVQPVSAVGEVVFTDRTSGWTATLWETSSMSPVVDPAVYSTDSPGLLYFSLSWAGDLSDQCALFASSADYFTVFALGSNAADCVLLVAQPVTLSASNPQCNYSLSWTYPFADLLTFLCATGPGVSPTSSQTIGLLFNSSGALAQGGYTDSAVYSDSLTGFTQSMDDDAPDERVVFNALDPAVSSQLSGIPTGDKGGVGSTVLKLSWNQAPDSEAEVWFLLPGLSSVTMTASTAACAFIPGSQAAVQLSANNAACSYNVSWMAAFDGALYLVYSLNSGCVDQQVMVLSLLFNQLSTSSSSWLSSSTAPALPSSTGSALPPPSPSGGYFITPAFFSQPPQCVAVFVLTDGSSIYCTTTTALPEQPFAIRMSQAGELQQVFVGPTAASVGGSLQPILLTVDGDGGVYSAYQNGTDYYTDWQLVKFSSSGQLQASFRSPFPGMTPAFPSVLSSLDYPVGLQTDADGNVYLLASITVNRQENAYLFQLDSSSGAILQQSAAIANDPNDYWFSTGLSLSAVDGSLVFMAGGYSYAYTLFYYSTQPLQLLRTVPLPDFPVYNVYQDSGELQGLGTDSRGDVYLTYTDYVSAPLGTIVVLQFDGSSGALLEVRETALADEDEGYGYYYGDGATNATFLGNGAFFAVDGAGNVYVATLDNATTAQSGVQEWGVYVATASTSPTIPTLPPPPSAPVSGAAVLTEYNSGWQALLYSGLASSQVDPIVYETDSPGPVFFSLNWAGDAVNQVTLVSSFYSPLTVTALSDEPACALLRGQPIALSASTPSCSYTVSWSFPYSDQLIFFYSTGPGVLPARALSVGLRFTMAGQQPGFAQPNGTVFDDLFSSFAVSFPSVANVSLSSVWDSSAVIYTGGGPGADNITVSCNGADCLSLFNQVWLLPPTTSLLTVLPSVSQCSIPPQSGVLLGLFDYPDSCSYGLSWISPIDALLPIVYVVSDYSGDDSTQALVIVLQLAATLPPALLSSSSSSSSTALPSSSSSASSAHTSIPSPSSSFSSSLPSPSSISSAVVPSSSSSSSSFPFPSSSSSSLVSSGLPVNMTVPPGPGPVYSFLLQSLSASALVATEPSAVSFAGQFLNNLVLVLVALLNTTAEAQAGLPSFSTLPPLQLRQWPDSLSAFSAWSEDNDYTLLYANASAISLTQSWSALPLQLPALSSTGYHRMILFSPNATSNLTDWLFVAPFLCRTLLLSDGQCVPCPAGAFCVGDGRAWPLPAYWSVNEHSVPDACPLITSCAGALDAGPSPQSPDPVLNPDGSRNTQRCYADYDSALCSGCDVLYYHDGLACRYCGSDNGGQLGGLIIAAIVIFAVLTLILTTAAPLSLEAQVGVVLVLQQAVTIGQTASQSLPNSWAWLASAFSDIALLNLNISMFQPGCLIAQLSFVSVFWVTLGLICLLALLFSLAAAARAALVQRYVNAGGKLRLCSCLPAPPAAGTALEGDPVPGSTGFLLRMQYLISFRDWSRDEACVALKLGSSTRAAFLPLFFVRWRQSMIVLGAVAYLRLTTVCLQMLDCVTVQLPVTSGDPTAGSVSQRVLTADYSTRCFQGEHIPAFAVSIVLLCCFSAGFVLLVAAGLWRIHSDAYIQRKMEALKAWDARAAVLPAAAEPELSTASNSSATTRSSAISLQELLSPSLPASHTFSLSRTSSAPPTPATAASRPSPGRLAALADEKVHYSPAEESKTTDTAVAAQVATHPSSAQTSVDTSSTAVKPLTEDELRLALRLLRQRLQRSDITPSNAARLSAEYLYAAQTLVLSERAASYGYLIAQYKPRAFLYPVPLLLLSAFVAAAVVFPSTIAVTLLLCGLAFIVQGAVTALLLPFTSTLSNGISLLSATSRLAQCLAALGILHAVNPSSYSPSPPDAAHSVSAQAELEALTERFFAQNLTFVAVLLGCLSLPLALLLLGPRIRRWRARSHRHVLDWIVHGRPAATHTAGAAAADVQLAALRVGVSPSQDPYSEGAKALSGPADPYAEDAAAAAAFQPSDIQPQLHPQQWAQAAPLPPLALTVATGRSGVHDSSGQHPTLRLDIASPHGAPLQILQPALDPYADDPYADDAKHDPHAEQKEQQPQSFLTPPPLPVRPSRRH